VPKKYRHFFSPKTVGLLRFRVNVRVRVSVRVRDRVRVTVRVRIRARVSVNTFSSKYIRSILSDCKKKDQ